MSRTKGSGWGAEPVKRYYCPKCGKKGVYHDYVDFGLGLPQYRCMYCKERMNMSTIEKVLKNKSLS